MFGSTRSNKPNAETVTRKSVPMTPAFRPGLRKRRSRYLTFACLAVVNALLTFLAYSYYSYFVSRMKEVNSSLRPAYHDNDRIVPNAVIGDSIHGNPQRVINERDQSTSLKDHRTSQQDIGATKNIATADDIRDFRFTPAHHQFNLTAIDNLEDKASVDYLACCGLGHRLSKMADAHYLSHMLNYGLRGFWGYCEYVEVFSYLFGPQPPEELARVEQYNVSAKIANVLPGGQRLVRQGNGECACHMRKMHLDAEFYASLQRRFRFRGAVDAFRSQHFSNRTVFAMHLRAGNGETGDYTWKKRGIQNETEWLVNFAAQIVQLVTKDVSNPVLFLATDTVSFIGKLQNVLSGIMPVIHYEQHRLSEGEGVLFGERSANITVNSREACLQSWENSLMDMMLLSYADILIAGRPSSFVESLPMSLVLDSSRRGIRRTYCEVNWSATKFQCFANTQEWCCNGTTAFAGHFRHEYTHNPPENVTPALLERWAVGPRSRAMAEPTQKVMLRPSYLPYDAMKYVRRSYNGLL
ncbi:hypothetical protein MPSEU_000434400 [Mayamaea pseudoterrestris]|nr:hypothetical protein MPSEU_000434400 [Mayamaea pseudoterrestris]